MFSTLHDNYFPIPTKFCGINEHKDKEEELWKINKNKDELPR